MISSIADYAKAFHAGNSAPDVVPELRGRVLHGKSVQDFETMTNKPCRRTRVMTMGPDGLQGSIGLDHVQILKRIIGYTDAYIRRLVVDEQESFKLVVFVAGSEAAPVATWDNVVRTVAHDFPHLTEKLYAALPALKSTPFADLQHQAGFNFAAADQEDHPDFMTAERLAACGGSPGEVRALLYHIQHLRELFSGDGYTYAQNGEQGVMEYMAPNQPLARLGDHVLIDLAVSAADLR